MVRLLIGAGGWAYFRVPGRSSLDAYSSTFGFVEVNSTYYRYPSVRQAMSWRRMVPEDFEFSVRCHKSIVEAFAASESTKIAGTVEKTKPICNVLNAKILAVLLPTDLIGPEKQALGLEELLSSFNDSGSRVAVEFRGPPPEERVLRIMQEFEAVHSVDISRDEPSYESDVLYSRLFGKGEDNVYQFDDEELRTISKKASAPKFEKSILAFHGVRMYGDAGRLKAYVKSGEFPMVTGQVGLDSLRSVLQEDARFPLSRTELVSLQGWKLFDVSRNHRARASSLLRSLPDGNYQTLDSVMAALQGQDSPGT